MTQRSGGALVISAAAVRRALLTIVALAFIAIALYFGRGFIRRDVAAEQIDRNGYQVVFMNSGQAFYGKLVIPDGDTYLLTDVFYLTNDDTGQPTRLVRRGAEVFGPREPMVVQAHHVLFFENLRDDSELVKGIRAIKSGQVTAPVVTAAPATGTPRPSATR